MTSTTVARSSLPRPPEPKWPPPDDAPADVHGPAFTIRLAHDQTRRAAGDLLAQRYAWRGYRTVTLPRDQTGWRTTLTAHGDGESPLGTLTLELDGGPEGLSAAAAFAPEVTAMRARGLRLAEFTRLAVETTPNSQRVLAGLFHVGFVVAHRLRRCDTLLLEVNPRHVRFYTRMLGCQVVGAEREHPGVRAPAVLLSAPFAYIRAQIQALAGTQELAGSSRSLYPFAFSASEEALILARLIRAQRTLSVSTH